MKVEILGQLLLMQTMLANLPNRDSIIGFVCRGLRDIPGVLKVKAKEGCTDEFFSSRDGSVLYFSCGHMDSQCFEVILDDPSAFAPYHDVLKNFFFMVGVVLDDASRQYILARYQGELEDRVRTRTSELAREVETRKLAEERVTQLNRDLDRRVRERTAELESALELLKKYQNELVIKEKIASLHPMATILAHELNTPLGNILTLGTTLSERSAELSAKIGNSLSRKELEEYLTLVSDAAEVIAHAAGQSTRLIQNYQNILVDQSGDQVVRFDLSEIISRSANLCAQALSGRHISLIQNINPGITLQGYPGLVTQVVSHLIQNAALHAFPHDQDGNITVSAREMDDDSGEHVILVVEDNGSGMSRQVRDRAFEPFFTTDMAKGSGVGLSMVYHLVCNVMGGTIGLEPGHEKGSVFTLTLPRVINQASREKSQGT